MSSPNGLQRVKDWMRVNKLCINPGKTEVLTVGPGKWVSPDIGWVVLPQKDQVCCFGVLLDLALNAGGRRGLQYVLPAFAGAPAASLPGKEGPCYCYMHPRNVKT